jgi:hypothetical protein
LIRHFGSAEAQIAKPNCQNQNAKLNCQTDRQQLNSRDGVIKHPSTTSTTTIFKTSLHHIVSYTAPFLS